MHGHSTNSNSNKKKIIFAIYSPLSLITLLLWIVNICKYNNSNGDLLLFPQWLPFWSGLKPSCSSKAAEHRILLSRSARCRLSADVEDRVPAVFSGGSGRSFWGGHVVIPKSVKNHEEEYKTYNWRETCRGKPYFLNTKTHHDPFSSQNHATEWL